MLRAKWLMYVFIISLLPLNLHAEGGKVSIEARVDKNRIRIGDLIKYSIIITRDKNIEIEMPGLGANLGAFEIRDYNDPDPIEKDGEVIQQRDYVISTYDVGEYEIPPVAVRYTTTGDTAWNELQTQSLKITVESMKPSEAGDIRDIKSPLEIPRDWWRLIRFVIAGFLLLLTGILVYLFIKRRQAGKPILPRREKPKLPPHEVALNELEKLIQEKLLEKGEVKLFYVKISEIIRQYIEERYFIVALEMTTFQLIEIMRESEIESNVIDLIEQFLTQCDLVKFAKYIPTDKENQNVVDLAYKIIEETKIVIEPDGEDTEDQSVEVIEDGEEKAKDAVVVDTEKASPVKPETEEGE